MIRMFLIAITMAAVVNVGTGYFMLGHINDSVFLATERAASHTRSVSAESVAADTELSNGIGTNTTLVDEATIKINALAKGVAQANSEFIKALESFTAKQVETDAAVSGVVVQTGNVLSRVTQLEEEAASVLELLEELNGEVQTLRLKLDSVDTSTPTAIGAIMDDVYGAGWEQASFVDDEGYLEPCPMTALNKGEVLPSLRRAMERSKSVGVHNVLVKFDIDQNGRTIIDGLESATAPNTLINAVRRYVNGLEFASPNYTYADCEMVVKLDIS